MSNTNPTNFKISSDFALLANKQPLTITVNIPGSQAIPAASQLALTSTVTVEQDSAQYVMGKAYSSLAPSSVIMITGNNPGGIARFDRATCYLAINVECTATSVTAYVYVQNKRNDIGQSTGVAESITFRLRPLGNLF